MAEELMLKVEDVYKRYRLGTIGGGTLTADLQSWWARVRHKEDPNSKIGAKTYGKNEVFYALNGISFEVRKGEALGIIGGNGAGKSTTLKLISQVTAPTEGKIYLNGRITSMLEVGTGFHPELTGRENIYLNGAILGMTKAEIDSKIEEIIDFSECRQFIDTPVKRYSSGMYVKLAFSVAAHLDSEIMIMDEVLAVGDMAFQKKCIDKMVGLSKEEGRTILYVSHNMNTIRRLCDRVVVLERGKKIFDGDVEKGVALYLSRSQSDFDVDIDLSKMKHVDTICSFDIVMKHLNFQGKIQPKYNDDETIEMIILCDAKKSLENIVFRLTLRSSDEYIIGTSWSNEFSMSNGDDQKIRISFPANCIPKGTFYASIGLYKFDETGTFIMIDHITKAFGFETEQKSENGKKIWLSNFWGHIDLPQTVVERLDVK